MIVEFAFAKINLALHVVGQRADGYHILQSLVTFAACGDRLGFTDSPTDQIAFSGRFGPDLMVDGTKHRNLVLIARDRMRDEMRARGLPEGWPVEIQLEKNLPLASGIGGGSADAAATLRGLNRFWGAGLTSGELASIGLEIGADVPMCVLSQPLLAEGIGEILTPRPDLPSFGMVIVNPLVAVSTPSVFSALAKKTNPRLHLPPTPSTQAIWMPLLKSWRNDLQQPAEEMEGTISAVLHLITRSGAELARMSGSGATCFGLYPNLLAAEAAADRIQAMRPEWYVEATLTQNHPESGLEREIGKSLPKI